MPVVIAGSAMTQIVRANNGISTAEQPYSEKPEANAPAYWASMHWGTVPRQR